MDALNNISKHQFVIEQLNRYTGDKKQGTNYTLVLCPFHNEKTPSGRISHNASSRSPGYFKCYACKAEAKWDDLAPMLGLEPYKKTAPKDEFANLVLNKPAEQKKEKLKFRPLPVNSVWRGIQYDLLMKLNAKLCKVQYESGDWSEPLLYLPVSINGSVDGYIKARLKKVEGKISYINAPGTWSKTRGLFPFDLAIELMQELSSSAIVLVEGQRDALRLIASGIPAVCILGTHSWSDSKAKLLEIAGVKTVVLFFDGDSAGIGATEDILPKVKPWFKIKTLKLWAMKGSPFLKVKDDPNPSKAAQSLNLTLWDPGNCPQRIIDKLKQKYFA